MSDKQAAKERMEVLKELREKHADTVARTQALLKDQQATRKLLKSAMKAGPMTVPEISQAVEMPADEVLWHVVAMKKYDLVVEVGQDGEYYQYALPEYKEAAQ
jgi:predicted Rossmann fold nucleotide-binding protein DprA/Smf involved in DNA uptake